MAKVRNGEIDVIRFLFATFIVCAHYNDSFSWGIFEHGHIGVEFFFLVSGYFMAVSAMKKKEDHDIPEDTWRYLLSKVSSFFGVFVEATILDIAIRYILVQHTSIKELLLKAMESISVLSLTSMGTYTLGGFYVSGTWYLSAMIISIAILYPLIRRFKKWVLYIWFPVFGCFMLGYMYKLNGGITYNFHKAIALTNCGLWRGLAEMMLGAFCYVVVNWINQYRYSKKFRTFMTVIKIATYMVVVYYILGRTEVTFDIYAFLYIMLGVVLSLSDCTYHIPNNALTVWLGKFSLSLFIFHGTIRYSADILLSGHARKRLVLCLVIASYVFSLAAMYLSILWQKRVQPQLVKFINNNIILKETDAT